MLLQLLLTILINLLNILTSWLPTVTTLPFIDSYLVSAMGGIHSLIENFPILQDVLTAFLIYLGFKLALLVMKLFMGSRTPTHG